MDELNEFYKKVQMYLMKKNQECNELQFLTSCITPENSEHINDICKSIVNIFIASNIPIHENTLINNERCIQSYKYLLLNTKFENQERLAEDIVSGHLVDMCPPLSLYLFVQILWSLEYENILIHSLLYIPLDLCTEILRIGKYIELSSQKIMNNMFQLILTAYIKFIQLKEVGIQSKNFQESIENFLINFEEFLSLLIYPKLTYLTSVSDLKKYEEYGIILKKLICTIKNCFEYKNKKISISNDLEKLYNITFGRESFVKCEDAFMENAITMLNKKMMDLLVSKVKGIDCNIYLSWAEIYDEENNMITLQRSIGNECYYFIEFIQSDEQLAQNTHMIECLQHLSSKPDPMQSNFVLSLQEVCNAISDDKKEFMKELLCRYKEWDRSVIDFVYEKRSLLDKRDYLNLLEYLTFIFSQSNEEEIKEYCYTVVTKILLLQSVPDIYEIATAYLTKHNGKNYLDSPHTEEAFNEFIVRNPNLKTSTNLKIVLLFLIKNLKFVLTTFVKIIIGDPCYKNIMIPVNDMLLLSPFMQIREDSNQTFLITILRTICMKDVEWSGKKFMDFIKVVLDNSVIKIHDLINNVFIPYLERDTLNVSNLNCVLNTIRKLQVKCTKDTNIKGLIIALAKKMSFLRKNTDISKYVNSEVIGQITRILEYFLEIKSYKISVSTKKEIITGIEFVLEPIDKLYFASLWYLTQKGISILDITEDYERRCFATLNRIKEDPKTSERLGNYLTDLNLSREDFLRHLIIRSTETEYRKLGLDLTIVYWFVFDWNDEIDAYNHFSRLTIEACCLSLEYPAIGGNDLFAFLLKSFTNFCKTFVLLEGMTDYEKVYRLLIKNIKQLNESIKHSPYKYLFTACRTNLDNNTQQDFAHLLQEAVNIVSCFSDQCLELNWEYSKEIYQTSCSPKISDFYITYEIISSCINVPTVEACECVTRLNELFLSS